MALATAPASQPASAHAGPPSLGETLSSAEAGVPIPIGPLPRAELSGLLRAVMEDATLAARMRTDPAFLAAKTQVDTYVQSVADVLNGEIDRARHSAARALESTAPWMGLASADQGARRQELMDRAAAIPSGRTSLQELADCARSVSGLAALADRLAIEVPAQVLRAFEDEAKRLLGRFQDSPGTVRRTQVWAQASREVAQQLDRVAEWRAAPGPDVAAVIDDARRRLAAHRDGVDLLEQEEQERVQRDTRDRDRRIREDRTLLTAAREKLPRVNLTLLFGPVLLVLLLVFTFSALVLLAILPALFGILICRETQSELQSHVWTLPRDDVDELVADLRLRLTANGIVILVVAITVLVLQAIPS